MTRIIADAALREKLLDLAVPVELCDVSGRVLARLQPVSEDTEPKISREERLRRKNAKTPTYTTAEVLAYLESL